MCHRSTIRTLFSITCRLHVPLFALYFTLFARTLSHHSLMLFPPRLGLPLCTIHEGVCNFGEIQILHQIVIYLKRTNNWKHQSFSNNLDTVVFHFTIIKIWKAIKSYDTMFSVFGTCPYSNSNEMITTLHYHITVTHILLFIT